MQLVNMKSVLLFAVVLAAAGCSSLSTPAEEVPTGSARFVIAVHQKQQNHRVQQLSVEDVTRVEVTLDAFDIEPNSIPLVKDGNLWIGAMESIRAGTGRRFHAEAFDSSDEKIYEGEVSGIIIVEGETVQVNILAQQVNRPPPLENEAPIIDSLVVSNPETDPNGVITLKAAAHDPNPGDTLTYEWTAMDGTFSDPSSLNNTWTAPTTAGRVTLTLTVTDQLGVATAISFDIRVERVGRGNAEVFVSFNTWPEVTSINATSTQVRVGQTITASSTTYDPDAADGTLSYSWSATCEGVWASGGSASAQFTPTKPPTDTTCNNCELSVKVSDGKGGDNTAKLAICVANITEPSYPPQLASVYQSSKTVTEGKVVTLRVNATDTRSRRLTFQWSSNVGTLGTPATTTAGTTGEVRWTTPSCLPSGVTPTVSVRIYAEDTPELYTDYSFTFTWAGIACSSTDVRPAAPVLSLPVDGFETTHTEVVFAGSGVPGSTVTVSNGTATATAIVDSSGGFSGPLTLAYGTHTLSATQSNGGLISTPSNSVTVLVRPAAPLLSLPVDGFETTHTEVAFAGSGVPGSTVTFSNGTATATVIVDSSGGFSGSLTLAYGTHTLSATQSTGGFTSPPSNSVTAQVRPAAPVLAQPMDGFDTNTSTVTVLGKGIPGATVTVSNGTSSRTAATVNTAGSFRVDIDLGLTNYGVHTLSVTQSVGVHTSVPLNVTVTFRPAPPAFYASSTTTSTDVTVQGRCEGPGWEVTLTETDADGSVSITKTLCDTKRDFSATLKLAYGPHTLSATQFNGVIQSNPSNSVMVDVRVPEPVVTTNPGSNFSTRISQAEVLVMGTGVPGATLNVFVSVGGGPPTIQQSITVDTEGRIAGSITRTRSASTRETHRLTFSQKVGGVTSGLASKTLSITFQ